ncbi:CoA pyrophosphatase [Castellaniella sp.]|uniref:CoA pyrophosphatase n=1 Tax=Castellaniella sp. TaxID=1955812 RepID=UPI00355E236C
MSQLIQARSVRHEHGFDPATQPVVPSSPLPALPPASLQLEHIRQAFKRPVSWQIEPLFSRDFDVSGDVGQAARQAAVLVPLVPRVDGLHVLLTRRAEHLHHHAGQVSFPGGCIEPTDPGPVDAAIRETREEIGIERQYVRVMGAQPSLLTTTRFLMTPIVGELLPGFRVMPDASEVAEVFEVPLAVLMDPARHVLHRMQVQYGEGRCYYSIRWGPHFIWGATAMLIRNLYHFLAAAQAGPGLSGASINSPGSTGPQAAAQPTGQARVRAPAAGGGSLSGPSAVDLAAGPWPGRQ